MEEDLEHGQHRGAVVTQHPEAVLAALSEHPLHAARPKPVHNVSGEAEWNSLWSGKDASLLKCNSEVNVDNFSLVENTNKSLEII